MTEIERAIETLYREIEQIQTKGERAMSKWISVEDKLPDNTGNVLVCCFWHKKYQTMIAWYESYEKCWRVTTRVGEIRDLPVTHWQPLPEPPEDL